MKAGWEIKRLPDIAEYFIGLTYTPKDVGNAGTIVLRSSNVQNDELDLSDLVRVTCPVKKSLYVRKGDILMCSRNGSKRLVGKTAVIGELPEEMTFGTFMTVIRSDMSPYLSWFFRAEAFREQIGVGENTMINQITKYMLDAIRVPIPPEAEQQLIVAILDEAFEAIAAARANAVQNRQNARALFESYLQSVFSQRCEGWVETTVGHQVDFLSGFAFKSSEYTDSEEGVRLVRGDNIVQGELRWDGVKRWPINDAPKYSQFFFNENDVVLAMDRPWVAAGLKVAFITKSDLPSLQVQRTARLRAKSTIHWKYLFHMLRSPEYVSYLLDGQTGLGVPHISGKQILSFEFPLPPLNEQQSIVQRLDALWEDTQRLESLYQRKIAALDELKQSLLQQAFSGQL